MFPHTIHSGLRIPVSQRRARGADPSELSSQAKEDLQTRLRAVDFILVDEFSMIGQALLVFMSIRGKQAVGGRPGALSTVDGLFGGLNLSSSAIPRSCRLSGPRRCGALDPPATGTPWKGTSRGRAATPAG